jgi:hypothetical protein
MNKKDKRIVGILSGTVLVLLIPLIAMHFTDEVNWTLSDFIVMGILLLGTGLVCEIIIRKVSKTNWRIALCLVILLVFFLTWAELAVGIFGTPFAGQ